MRVRLRRRLAAADDFALVLLVEQFYEALVFAYMRRDEGETVV